MVTLVSDPLPFHHPEQKGRAFRPLKALRHFRQLLKDKEDTEQVFHIIDALYGKRYLAMVRRFWESPRGKQLLGANERLYRVLDDHARWEALPAGTVGRAYMAFMRAEGLTAAGLEEEHNRFLGGRPRYDDVVQRYADRMRDTHDMLHVLTGYGRDALGEQGVLAFTYSQSPNLGIRFIAYAGAFEMKRRLPANPHIWSAVRQGEAIGKAAANIAQQDIVALMAEPLDAARARLNIGEPTEYRAALAHFRAIGLDPYKLSPAG